MATNRLIGLIGGTSWISTIDYYRLINERINKQLGGLNYSRCIIHSLNYGEVRKNNDNEDWDANFKLISDASENMIRSGAEAIVLCANTMHLLADKLQKTIGVPLINIASETARVIKNDHLKKAGLLGTRFTMERSFFRDKLQENGIEALIPNDKDRIFVHDTVFEELGRGIVKPATKERYISIIEGLTGNGAQGIILGCTEIPLLIGQEDVSIPVFDTLSIHVNAVVAFAVN